MQIQHPLSDSQGFGAIDRKFCRTQVSMQCDDGLVLEGRLLCSDLQRSTICNQNILCLQLNICLIKNQSPALIEKRHSQNCECKCTKALFNKGSISLNKHTLDKEHLQHWGAGVQEDGLARSDYGKRALLRRGETTPCIWR